MFGSEVMQSDARGFDNEGICYSSHKVKMTADIGIKNNGLAAPQFLAYDSCSVWAGSHGRSAQTPPQRQTFMFGLRVCRL